MIPLYPTMKSLALDHAVLFVFIILRRHIVRNIALTGVKA
jgi:hypothetical protein